MNLPIFIGYHCSKENATRTTLMGLETIAIASGFCAFSVETGMFVSVQTTDFELGN
jgi:hypothetical protein